ncbi:MAG: PEP/pyruvate-binding domain-containing protein, partial [Candidatus Omnitrophota bacterium]
MDARIVIDMLGKDNSGVEKRNSNYSQNEPMSDGGDKDLETVEQLVATRNAIIRTGVLDGDVQTIESESNNDIIKKQFWGLLEGIHRFKLDPFSSNYFKFKDFYDFYIRRCLPVLQEETDAWVQIAVGGSILPTQSMVNPLLLKGDTVQDVKVLGVNNQDGGVDLTGLDIPGITSADSYALGTMRMGGILNQQQQPEAKKTPFRETPLSQDSKDLLFYAGLKQLFEKLTDNDRIVRQAAATAIAEIAKARPELISKEITTRLFEKLNDNGSVVRQAATTAIGEIIAGCGIDLARIDYYKDELLNPKGKFKLKERELSSGYLIISFFLERKADLGLWLGFADKTEEDFSQLTSLLAGSIMTGGQDEVLKILKEKLGMKETILSLEDLLLKKAGLSLYAPTRSWNNLQEWLNYCNRFSGTPPEKALAHIIITMKLLQAGVGEEAGFRATANVETRLPEIRDALIQLLGKPIPILAQRRLVKALALGTPDQIDRLRNQAINLAVAVTGSDIRGGLVGEIRDRIHNRPSPQDLFVARAYRIFIERGDASGLNKLGYTVSGQDAIPARLRQGVLEVCDNLIATLEDIYGEGSTNSLQEYFQRWQNAVIGQEELKGKISALLGSAPGTSFDSLEGIIQIRQGLHLLLNDLTGEPLLLTILLDNRLELLFYRRFNEIKEKINFSLPQEALKVMFNLLEITRLNGYAEEEISIISREISSLSRKESFAQEDWLKLYSLYKRIERSINFSSQSTIADFQEMAKRLASGIGVGESIWVENFSSNIFRSDTIYLLSLALKEAKEITMQKAKISGWQVVVAGEAEGRVRFIKDIHELKSVKPDEIIIVEELPSEAPPVTKSAAIITFKEDGLLSHPAIRARQHNIPFAVCPDSALLDGLNGQWVKLTIRGEEVVLSRKKELVKNKGPPQPTAREKISIITADLNNADIVVMPENYRPERVGNKSFRLQQIPANLLLGQFSLRHFSLSFSLFKQVLDLEANSEIKARLLKLQAKALKNPSAADIADTLVQMRLLIEGLTIPDEYLSVILGTTEKVFGKDKRLFLRSSTNAEDLAGYQAAGLYDSFGNVWPQKAEVSEYIRKVWVSVWNDRAFFDRQANGIDHSGVFPAILIQEMVMPDYAFVIHTQNPDGADRDELLIELVQGLGESLVSGNKEFAGSPYRFIYNRKSGRLGLIGFANKSKKLILEDGKLKTVFVFYKDEKLLTIEGLKFIKTVAQAAVRIEERSGHPQDIEGALLSEDGIWKVVFLQSRDQPLNGIKGIEAKKEKGIKQLIIDLNDKDWIVRFNSAIDSRDGGEAEVFERLLQFLPEKLIAESKLKKNVPLKNIIKANIGHLDGDIQEYGYLVRVLSLLLAEIGGNEEEDSKILLKIRRLFNNYHIVSSNNIESALSELENRQFEIARLKHEIWPEPKPFNNEAVKLLIEKNASIWLFESFVKGNMLPDSDLDFIFELENDIFILEIYLDGRTPYIQWCGWKEFMPLPFSDT